MKKWYYQFAINYSWSPSLFETDSYKGKGGYYSKEEARKAAIESVDERIEDITEALAKASKEVGNLSRRLNEQIESKNKLKNL